MARVCEKKQVQNQVQRAPGRLAVRAPNLEFSLVGKGPEREKVGRWRDSEERTWMGWGSL